MDWASTAARGLDRPWGGMDRLRAAAPDLIALLGFVLLAAGAAAAWPPAGLLVAGAACLLVARQVEA